ncbi:hypothetical protein DQ384_38405 [Sphaerisporangium album]|uniref:Tyr recombinase domain-containing protein n=1 Tax=Sphaerisporangium album TaxID=509200 RepID=A0A367EN72_9ACTN|nr:hypothetical protein DQ384_38405 [Sphaerisporangium album]
MEGTSKGRRVEKDARVHDARHTAATLLLEQGVDISVVQEILGHHNQAVHARHVQAGERCGGANRPGALG